MKYTFMLAAVIGSLLIVTYLKLLVFDNDKRISEEIPPTYHFLLFPKDSVSIYADNKLKKEINFDLNRAVTATYQEIRDGVIQVALGGREVGYSLLEDYTYLPKKANQVDMIANWNNSLKYQGYSMGEWEEKAVEDDRSILTLRLIDHKHARSTTYRYIADHSNVYSIFHEQYSSGVVYSIYIITVTIYLMLLVVVSYFYSKSQLNH